MNFKNDDTRKLFSGFTNIESKIPVDPLYIRKASYGLRKMHIEGEED